MNKRANFYFAPDDPPISGSPIIGTEPEPEPEPEVAVEPEPEPDPEPERLTLEEWESRNPKPKPEPEPRVQTQGDVIEGTSLMKPDGYDTWGLDKQMAYIAQTTTLQANYAAQAASRAARTIEAKAEDWYRSQLQEIVSSCDQLWLANATDQEKESLVMMAMGKAMKDGKSPTSAKLPGASPTNTRATTPNTPSSEVDALLADLRAAGYDKVADSKKVKEILSR